MKNTADLKRQSRIAAFKILFERDFIDANPFSMDLLLDNLTGKYKKFTLGLIHTCDADKERIERFITRYSEKKKHYLPSLRYLAFIAIAEFIRFPETSGKIVINEALEICKEYTGKQHVPFLNGLLHSVWTETFKKA